MWRHSPTCLFCHVEATIFWNWQVSLDTCKLVQQILTPNPQECPMLHNIVVHAFFTCGNVLLTHLLSETAQHTYSVITCIWCYTSAHPICFSGSDTLSTCWAPTTSQVQLTQGSYLSSHRMLPLISTISHLTSESCSTATDLSPWWWNCAKLNMSQNNKPPLPCAHAECG
jgi:hypothetical protein